MIMREIFKKVATYNEVADAMGGQRAKIVYIDFAGLTAEFDPADFNEVKKSIEQVYMPEFARAILTETRFKLGGVVDVVADRNAPDDFSSIDVYATLK